MSDETVTKQVLGFNSGELLRGDWSEFQINIGRQYPVKLATKKEEIKQMARAAGQNQAVWTFHESDGNPNPHKPGTFFKNRYLENVVVGGQLDPALAQSGQTGGSNAPAGQQGGSNAPDDRSRSIERQVVVKAAIGLYPPAAIANADDFWALMDKLAEWITQPGTPPAQEGPPPGQSDDDIPF